MSDHKHQWGYPKYGVYDGEIATGRYCEIKGCTKVEVTVVSTGRTRVVNEHLFTQAR